MPNKIESLSSKVPVAGLLSTPYTWLNRLLAPCDDYWTWMTNDGSIYEGVDILQVARGMVTFRHLHGTASVLLSDLPVDVQASLRENVDDMRESTLRPTSLLMHSMSKAG